MTTYELYMITESSAVSENQVISNNKDEIVIETILQDLGAFNRNGRKYEKSTLAPAIATPEIKELMANRTWFGEYGHPIGGDLARQVTIDAKYASHEIMDIWIDGNNIKGKVSSIPTKYGREFRDLILRGTKVAFSLRAVGNIKKLDNGRVEVVPPMRVITYDCVVLPSHKTAYQTSILSESTMGFNGIAVAENHKLIMSNDEGDGQLIPVNVSTYVKNNSENVKTVVESLDFMYDKSILLENGTKIALISSANNSKLVIPLENYISKEVDKMLLESFL